MEPKKLVKDKDFYLKSGKFYSDKFAHLDRRVEFRKYLDRTGALDKLTMIFMDLYENPVMDGGVIEYVRKNLVVPNPDEVEIASLRPKLEEGKSYRDFLENENKVLRATLDKAMLATSVDMVEGE